MKDLQTAFDDLSHRYEDAADMHAQSAVSGYYDGTTHEYVIAQSLLSIALRLGHLTGLLEMLVENETTR